MEKFLYYNALYLIYKDLLNDNNKEVFDNYYGNDMTMQEIADLKHISKSRVGVIIKNVERKLDKYESVLKIYAKNEKLNNLLKLDDINKMKIVMDHPGGGSAQSLSYKPQKRIETLESLFKPDMMLIGHYHKAYDFVYRNVRGILVPSFCDKTQFQQKQGLSNYVGAYFLDIYSDKKGNIQYFEPDLVLFNHKDMWDEAGRDKKKVKQLVID